MHSNHELIEKAIDQLIGQVGIGDTVAHRSHELTHKLVDILGDSGVCALPDGTVNIFPVAELFDANKVKDIAVSMTKSKMYAELNPDIQN